MKKGTKGEAVLSARQIQATRLNRLEYRRLQNHIDLLRDDLQNHLARLHRQEESLRYHYMNVVRVVKPNRSYQLWKQAHAHEIAQDEEKDLIESMKLKQKSNSNIRKRPASSSNENSSEPTRSLLAPLDNDSDTSIDPIINKTQNFLRPKTSPVNKPLTTQYRINPLLALLDGCLVNPNNILQQQQQQQQQQYPFDSSSFYSSSSIGTASSQKLIQHKFGNKYKASDLDALYRIALQNQTAYQSVEKKVIEARKLQDKQFALQYRALKGSMRLARLPN